jgi:hypothetical protein
MKRRELITLLGGATCGLLMCVQPAADLGKCTAAVNNDWPR